MIKRYVSTFKWLIFATCLSFTSNPAYASPYTNPEQNGYPSHDRAVRMGNWSYRQNWRYNKDAYFKGESQSQAYKKNHPYGQHKIGYDGQKKNGNGSHGKNNGAHKSTQNQNGHYGKTSYANTNQSHNKMSRYLYNDHEISDNQRTGYYPQNQYRNHDQYPYNYRYYYR